jgi:hypothetical protein
MNTNVDDYTINELMDIIGIDSLTEKNVISVCEVYIQQFTALNNQQLITFFQNIEKRLLDEIDGNGDEETGDDDEETGGDDDGDDDKPIKEAFTQRGNPVEVADNGHSTMSKPPLVIPNTFRVSAVQDSLNPTLQNTVSRFIQIDSQYRQASVGDGFSLTTSLNTDITLDLSEHMINVLSIRLADIEIPFSWFNINSNRNFFYIYNRYLYNDKYYLIKIEEGNYTTIDDILLAINNAFVKAGFVKTTTMQNFIYLKNGKVFIDLNNTSINGDIINIYDDTKIGDSTVSGIFFYPLDESQTNISIDNTIPRTQFDYENTLGWLLGYRQVAIYIYSYGNAAEALYKLHVLNYLIIVIDDFNQNHINNGIVTITELSNRIPVNRYNTANNPYYCIRYNKRDDPFNPIRALNVSLLNTPLSIISEKIVPPFNDIVHILPSAPRSLTQTQIYVANELAKAYAQTTRFKTTPPNNSDTFAIYPISTKGVKFGDLVIETGSTLQLNQRVYFGPVNLDRLRVKILDDKGNLMDFNGSDWSMKIIAECLYQY